MRSLVETRIIWLGLATYVAYACEELGVAMVGAQLLLLLVLSWRPQKVTCYGLLWLALFCGVLSFLDAAFGDLRVLVSVRWLLVGACYLILYEYIALYELSSVLRDYRTPQIIVCILNFGIRFIPIAYECTQEAYLGMRAKGQRTRNPLTVAKALAPAVFVRVLHKFEEMWLSYHLRALTTKRFAVRLRLTDGIFAALCLTCLLLIFVWHG